MTAQLARCILRIIAVVTMLIGVIGISSAIVAAYGFKYLAATMSLGLEVNGTAANAGFLGTAEWLVVVGWGFVLWQVSRGLARLILSEPAPVPAQPQAIRSETARS